MPVAVRDPAVLAPPAAFARLRLGLRGRGSSRAEHGNRGTYSQVALDRRRRDGGNRAADGKRGEPDPVGVTVVHQKIPVVQSGSFCAGQPLKPDIAIATRPEMSDQRAQNDPSGMSSVVP